MTRKVIAIKDVDGDVDMESRVCLLFPNMQICIVYNGNAQEWYLNRLLHREDGPAFCGKGYPSWFYVHGHRLTEEEYEQWRECQEK